MTQPTPHHPYDDVARLDPRPDAHPEGRGLAHRLGNLLRSESSGGLLLILGAVIAIVWANTPAAAAYFDLRDLHVALPLGFTTIDLSLGHWAADGLLAVFFFIVGVELKEEFVVGELRSPRKALTPVAAAFGGVAVPALIFVAINAGAHADTLRGWAIPTATDIAFAVAILAVVGKWLPSPLRLFLLTLAVVDDLIAIVIIAIFYANDLSPAWLALALLPAAAFGLLVQLAPDFFRAHRWAPWLILLPLGFATWVCVYESGIHATIAGVVLGFLVPAKRRRGEPGEGLAQALDHRIGPLSAGFCVPVFAFFSAGVAMGGFEGMRAALGDPVVWGIVLGLVFGKPLGILAATWLVTRTPAAELDPRIKWGELLGVGILGGIGFTVALLVAELSYGQGNAHDDHAKIAILVASVLAALLAAAWLAPANRRYKAEALAERSAAQGSGAAAAGAEDASR
ncbi:Na+/H+ antiporter NhaA [Galactobacter valiniphilus]|uniref:Na(+)/H(+) antiporter NhaA n=1 Tax=Galactobacter valiniphilus TaxID=2676122 RepID=A0A399JHN9_9MICC|nr:Na+/H+ antiporter NhaA [Galactobacter valiniphilus]RII41966.1 Na+/H+ antiporter NhaA [Galactobacter valiniphilus]